MRQLLLLGGVAACDSTFSLVHLDDPIRIDARVDGDIETSCWNSELLADEDMDGIKDGCDLCPADPMSSLVDADGDLIDDVCDPHKAMAIDTLRDFDGFRVQRLWQEQSGVWSFDTAAGTYSTTSTTAIVETELAISPTVAPTLDVVLTGDSGIGVYMKLGAGPQVIGCEHIMGSDPTPDRLALTNNGSQIGMQDFDVGSGAARMRMHVGADGNVQCFVQRGGTSGSIVTNVPIATNTTAVAIGLISRNGNTTFKSVTLFGQL